MQCREDLVEKIPVCDRGTVLELVKQIAVREGVTEQLKAQDQMQRVQWMNNIRDRAMEVVNNNLIYA
jgi:hypothetical protein